MVNPQSATRDPPPEGQWILKLYTPTACAAVCQYRQLPQRSRSKLCFLPNRRIASKLQPRGVLHFSSNRMRPCPYLGNIGTVLSVWSTCTPAPSIRDRKFAHRECPHTTSRGHPWSLSPRICITLQTSTVAHLARADLVPRRRRASTGRCYYP